MKNSYRAIFTTPALVGFTVTDDAPGVHFNSPGILIGDHRGPFGGPGFVPTFAQPVKNCLVEGNVLDHNDFGIYLFNAQGCKIVNNVAKNGIDYASMGQGGIGIILWDDGFLEPGNTGNKIVGNEIFDNQRMGIFIGTWNPPETAYCAGTKVHGNKVYDSVDVFAAGNT